MLYCNTQYRFISGPDLIIITMSLFIQSENHVENQKIIEQALSKFAYLLELRESGYELAEVDGRVIGKRGDNPPMTVLHLDVPASKLAWSVFRGDTTYDDLLKILTPPPPSEIRTVKIEKTGESLLRLRKQAEEYIQASLRTLGIVVLSRLIERLKEEGASPQDATVVAFSAMLNVSLDLMEQNGSTRYIRVGNPPEAIVSLNRLHSPWRTGSGFVFVSSYCYNPAFSLNGYRHIPSQDRLIKIETSLSERFVTGKIVWSENPLLVGLPAYFSRLAGAVKPNATYWTYLYKLGKKGKKVWVYGLSQTVEEALLQRERVVQTKKQAGHITPSAYYGVDNWFKPYRVTGLLLKRGALYSLKKSKERFVVRAKKGMVREVLDAQPLVEAFDRAVERYQEPMLDIYAFKAAAAGSYIGALRLGALIHLPTLHNILFKHGGSQMPPYYFITVVSKYNVAVRRLANYSYHGVVELTNELKALVSSDYIVVRTSRIPVYRKTFKKAVPVFFVNIAVEVSDKNFGSTVKLVNAVNRMAISEKHAGEEVRTNVA